MLKMLDVEKKNKILIQLGLSKNVDRLHFQNNNTSHSLLLKFMVSLETAICLKI